MSNFRQTAEAGVLVRFWTLDHHRGEHVDGPPSPWPMLVYAESGALFVDQGSTRWALTAHRALCVPAGERASMRLLAPARVRSLYFGPEFPVSLPETPIEVLPLLRELIVAACARGPLLAFRPDHVALAELLRYELGMALTHPVGLPWPQSEWLQRFATSAADTPADADRLIAETGYSRRTVERAMVAQTRLSLGRWLRQARMLRALAILSGGGSVGEAALGAGYSEPSAFIHAFRHAYGVTPGRLRG